MNLTPEQKRKLLKPGRKYDSVAAMVRETRGDHRFAAELDEMMERQRLVNLLTALRCQRGLKQSDVARLLGCTQSKVSKFEASDDRDLPLRDILEYAEAVGCKIEITVGRKDMKKPMRRKREVVTSGKG
jgi:predicted XRE-type DNA-binding protein